MPITDQKCILVCTAHLDPVWVWPWEEGLTEAISTFRVAADFCDQYPDFIFNHNESVLYEWVERNDPALFKRIKALVKKGKWHIAGGSFIQPDMIAASGESLVRQFLVGKRYFMEKFGVDPTTAYNFDSFGHPQGYIQILKGCGFDSYIFTRPSIWELQIPIGSFRWKHASGAEIVARRSNYYCTQGQIYNKISWEDWDKFHRPEGVSLFLWGLGNHGGGPTHAEYADLKRLHEVRPEVEFIESTPEDFFKQSVKLRGYENLPVFQGDFKPTFLGCYTSMQRIKLRHRQLENLMHLTEKLAAMAWWRKLRPYPTEDLTVAWKDILFAEFHDILPGSGVPKVEEESLNLLGHAEEILRRKKAETIIALLGAEPLAERNETPIFVFNPHSWTVTQEVEIDYGTDRQFLLDGAVRFVLRKGKVIPAQFEKPEENLLDPGWGEWRAKAVFEVTIPPFSYQRFNTDYKIIPDKKIKRWQSPKLPKGNRLTLKTDSLVVAINLKTGLLDGIKSEGREVLLKGAGAPLVFKDINHSWDTLPKWTRPLGKFKLAAARQVPEIIGSDFTHQYFPKGKPPISIIEDGPIRTIVECIFTYKSSYIVQRYIVNKKRPLMHIEQVVFWAEHDKKLRLELLHDPALSQVEVEKAYSIDDETQGALSGDDRDLQHFIRLSAGRGKGAFAVISHGTHSYAHLGNQLQMGILRSPSYASITTKPPPDTDRYLNRYIPRQDQGIRHAKFTLVFGERAATREAVARTSYEQNVPLEPFIYFPTKGSKRPKVESFASVNAGNVLLTAVKKAEGSDALVLRFWETAGRRTRFKLRVENRSFDLQIGACEIKTFLLEKTGKIVESDLIERPLPS